MLAVARYLPAIVFNDNPDQADVIIDDIYDSGATRSRYNGKQFEVLFDKRQTPWKGQWLVMPWEVNDLGVEESGDDIVTRLLQYIGEDPTREGLRETPRRVLNAWREWATGYGQDPATILKLFEDGAQDYDELVVVHNVPVVSKCEHHLADIIGHAHVGYIPKGKIVGLSKLARVVDIFARRLQVQERMSNQIADALMEHLQPLGAGVIIRAQHSCMSTRGVKVHGSVTTTSAMRGALLDKPAARSEFIDLCRMAEQGNKL
jgi:GTP cyclohydrolase I